MLRRVEDDALTDDEVILGFRAFYYFMIALAEYSYVFERFAFKDKKLLHTGDFTYNYKQ